MKKILLVCLFITVFFSVSSSQPLEIPEGSLCHVCGMKVDSGSPFSAQAVNKDGKLLAFCDIGDMLIYYSGAKEKPDKVYVKDYNSKAWIPALNAVYIKSEKIKTPMAWGIAAFKEKADATKFGVTLNFNEALDVTLTPPMKKHMMH